MRNSEKWAVIDIPNSADKYEISSLGKVRKTKTSGAVSILGGTVFSGSRYVYICGNQYAVHHLVANAFIPNPEGYFRVIHKDGNNLNNEVSNLMWSDKTVRKKSDYTAISKTKLLCSEVNMVFSSLRSAAYFTQIPQDIISRAIQNNDKVCGLTFQWVSSDSELIQNCSSFYIDFDTAYQKALNSQFVQEFHSEIERLGTECKKEDA